ncbi:MAG: type III-B CRISPR module RAMP protein Cmr1 [Firmicutes bacterium]|nr:type III-B CRISPR module RAMP protein Cmr1 [Bacillota bacterium]
MEVKTLTPLWTGGTKSGAVDRVHETGIIGSLRWWFEVMVRGMGGEACNPTAAEEKCIYDAEKPNKGICRVCEIFGATGWRRLFRLVVDDYTKPDPSVEPMVEASRSYTDSREKKRQPSWYFPKNLQDKPRTGNLVVQIYNTMPDFQPAIIGGLLQFMADWAAIGARNQLGFGVFQLPSGRIDTKPLYEYLVERTGTRTYTMLPSLQNIFLARIRLENATVQDTFNLKYDIRQLFSGQQNKSLRHFVMGTTKDQRIAAKVKISRPYNNGLIRVWGWIPEEAGIYKNSWNREKIIDAIYQHLSKNYTLEVWREMDSPRDTVTSNISSAQTFLRSILGLREEDDEA